MTANAKRLAYFDWVDPIAMEMLSKRSEIELVRLASDRPEAENWSALDRVHGYQILPRTELRDPWFGDAALIARCPKLLCISSTGAGFDMIDVEACTKAGIIVVCQTGTNKEGVAEHALSLIIALSKKIGLSDKAMRRGNIDRQGFIGNDVLGKTVGIVGLGHIGKRLAELCSGLLRMRVLACDPYLDRAEIGSHGAEKVELAQLLAQSDFVTVHCPRNDETFGMFGAAQFAAMKRTAYFLNTARGGLHNEDDLAAALSAGTIAGAGLDVFLKEPPPAHHPLLAFDNVIVTPHIAGVTHEALHEMARAAAEQWIGMFAGEVPPRLVNPEVWPTYSERFATEFSAQPQPIKK